MENLPERFQLMLDHLGYTAYKLCRELDTSDALISNIRAGKTKPGSEFLTKLVNKYEWLDLNWLLTGQGNMIRNTDENKPDLVLSAADNSQKMAGKMAANVAGIAKMSGKTTIQEAFGSQPITDETVVKEQLSEKERIITAKEATIAAQQVTIEALKTALETLKKKK